jgi:segregation and condensation protein A
MVYQVKLQAFEGPLDLLLHLIKVNEIDIYDIPIAKITEEYLRYLTMMEELDLEVAGEFLVLAATLVYIKSKMLLPAPPSEEGEILEEDPRTPLMDMLLEYQRFKSAAEELAEREAEQRQFFPRLAPFDLPESDGPMEINLIDLLTAFRGVLERAKERSALELTVRSITVGERMVGILDLLAEADTVTFISLFPETADQLMVVMTFLALLELLRQGTVKVRQVLPFGEILISRAIL